MARNVFLGGATAVAQVDTFTPANVQIGDVFTLTATAEDGSTTVAISFTATAATVANVTAGLTAAWNASTNALCTPITAADQTTSMKLTADTAGQPFYVSSSTTDGGGANTQTLSRAATTANAGPYDWNTAANWLTGAVPTTGDHVYIDGRAANKIIYGLDQDAVTLASLHIGQGMIYEIGTLTYPLRVGATLLFIGEPAEDGSTAAGSALVNLNLSSIQSTIHGYATRNTGTSGYPPVQIAGTHASNTATLKDGFYGFGTSTPHESYTMDVNVTGRAKVVLGTGGTVATVNVSKMGGEVLLKCAATTINQDAGKLVTEGTGAITTLKAGGEAVLNSTGTITNLYAEGSGVAKFTESAAARTVTNAFIVGPNAQILADNGKALSVTFTNGIDFLNGAKTKQLDIGDSLTLTPSAL